MADNAQLELDLASEDLDRTDWDRLVGDLASGISEDLEIQGCGGGCGACDNCGAGWCTGLCL